jgi:NADH-quinone oxidoreductase subunit K
MVNANQYVALAAVLFGLGLAGVLVKRNVLVVFMCIELMLNAVNLSFVAYARLHQDMGGHVFVFLSITVAAAEAAVGLAILLTIFRTRATIDVDNLHLLQG